jgi:hypothetical protein
MTASDVSGSKLLGFATREKDGQLINRSFSVLNFFTAEILFLTAGEV